jgi:gamma-glutamyltranspeptidase
LCVVDADRNAVSLTTSVNWHFGAGIRSTSTGIVINNEMDDFSIPTDISPEKLPPAPTDICIVFHDSYYHHKGIVYGTINKLLMLQVHT